MKEKKKIIEEALITINKWNIITLLLGFPIMIGMFIFVSYYIPELGKLVAQSESIYASKLSCFETKLNLPSEVLLWFFFLSYFGYFVTYVISKYQKVKAYLFNLYLLCFLSGLVYYSVFYGLQYFIVVPIIRASYWFLFMISIFIIIFLGAKKRWKKITLKSKQYSKILPVLMIVYFILTLFIDGFEKIIAMGILSIISVIPLLLMIFFVRWTLLTIINSAILKEVLKNQEYYRKELGYSIEEWYGKKSKMYRDSVKQNDLE